MRFGDISYKTEDVETWKDNRKWKPTADETRRLKQKWKSTPTARLKFVSDNGVVTVLVNDETTMVERAWNSCSIS